MATSAAARQAKYRKSALERSAAEGGEVRLSLWVSLNCKLSLRRLARHHGETQQAVLERLIRVAEDAALEKIETDSPEWDRFFNVNQG